MPKKSEKKEVPPPAPEPEAQPEFKLPKKKPSRQIPKEEKKEEEAPFGKISLKKSTIVKRTWDDPSMESVDLKHHEFERAPQDVEVPQCAQGLSGSLAVTMFFQSEGMSTVKLGKMIDCELDEKEEKQKKKKSKKEEGQPLAEEEASEPSDEVTCPPPVL